jgi:hypothetical protein
MEHVTSGILRSHHRWNRFAGSNLSLERIQAIPSLLKLHISGGVTGIGREPVGKLPLLGRREASLKPQDPGSGRLFNRVQFRRTADGVRHRLCPFLLDPCA